MPQRSHLEETIKKFVNKFPDVQKTYGYGETRGTITIEKEVVTFIIQSHINYLEGEIEKIKQIIKRYTTMDADKKERMGMYFEGVENTYNDCLQSLQLQLEEAKEML